MKRISNTAIYYFVYGDAILNVKVSLRVQEVEDMRLLLRRTEADKELVRLVLVTIAVW